MWVQASPAPIIDDWMGDVIAQDSVPDGLVVLPGAHNSHTAT